MNLSEIGAPGPPRDVGPSTRFAQAKSVRNIESCYFYHTMEIPRHGLVQGEWDLRAGIDDYLGHVDFHGKRVLDVGAASGFLSFSIESRGGDVISYDLSPDQEWDVVPCARVDYRQWLAERKMHLEKIDNAYWLAHEALQSNAKKVHGTVYDIPHEIRPVDIAVFGSILLHPRDPFLALQKALALTRETVIVTDVLPRHWYVSKYLKRVLPSAVLSMRFLPDYRTASPIDAWWSLTPELVQQFLGVLGFEGSTVSFHSQPLHGHQRRLFTVVGRRTASPQ